jgi:ATP-dependent Lhr-like helicase
VEELAAALQERDVTTFVSHSSLSVDERRRAESAFADARECVIVSTSTLELGIDVGDLDRVVQIDSPRTVASFLQRVGRSGRRAGTSRNALFLTTQPDTLVQAAGLLSLWGGGWVEPVIPPPSPRHIVAQQVLALCLQEHRIGDNTWTEWLRGLDGMLGADADLIAQWLVESGHLETESGMLFIGPQAERRYGRRHFMDLVSVFTAEPEFRVLAGRREVGTVDPLVLTRKVDGPRVVVLGGRSWQVTHVDWRRRCCWVEPGDTRGAMRWQGQPQPLSFELCRARRDVLLGADPPVTMTRRASAGLASARADATARIAADATIIDSASRSWWTWAGGRANATLAAALVDLVDQRTRYENDRLRLREGVTQDDLTRAIARVGTELLPVPDVDPEAIRGLKFGESLPPHLAARTLSERLADPVAAARTLRGRRIWTWS